MFFPAENLRLIDEYTLVEVEQSETRTRPLEWRRSFNYLRFETSEFIVEQTHRANEAEIYTWLRRDHDGALIGDAPFVKRAVKSELSLSTSVSFDDIKETFYQLFEVDKDSHIFSTSPSRAARKLVLCLSESDGIAEDHGVFKSGSFYGGAFFNETEDSLDLLVTASKEAISDLIEVISSGTLDKVIFNVAVSSFSYEVDDGLREGHEPRTLLLHGFSSPAALETIKIRRTTSSIANPNSSDPTQGQSHNRDYSTPDSSREAGFRLKYFGFDASPLKSLNVALLVFMVLLFWQFFK